MLDSGKFPIVLWERKFYVNFTWDAASAAEKAPPVRQTDRGRFCAYHQRETIFQAHHSSSTAITTLTAL